MEGLGNNASCTERDQRFQTTRTAQCTVYPTDLEAQILRGGLLELERPAIQEIQCISEFRIAQTITTEPTYR